MLLLIFEIVNTYLKNDLMVADFLFYSINNLLQSHYQKNLIKILKNLIFFTMSLTVCPKLYLIFDEEISF